MNIVVSADDEAIERDLSGKRPFLHPVQEPLMVAEHRPDLGQSCSACCLVGSVRFPLGK